MSPYLETALEQITSAPDIADRDRDAALNSFPPPPAIVEDHDEYRSLLAHFYCHLECQSLHVDARAPDMQFDLSRCWALLQKKLGASAPQAGFEIARTGAEGGVRGLLQMVAGLYARQCAENMIGAAVTAYWSSCSPDVLLADAEEYISSYRHIVPDEIAEGSGARILANFRRVLEQHPFVIRRLQNAGVE